MARTVRHFSLHRITGARPGLGEGTELRVVADVEEGVLPLIEMETAVIRGYARQEHWPHRWVTLFVLEDLQPLVRQLRLGAAPASLTTLSPALGHPPGGELAKGQPLSPESAAALEYRPVVNVYDLADLTGCNIFANRRAMVEQGYWDDPLALRGLLAHEHAHPLAENETARASRRLKLELQDFGLALSVVERLRIEEKGTPKSEISTSRNAPAGFEIQRNGGWIANPPQAFRDLPEIENRKLVVSHALRNEGAAEPSKIAQVLTSLAKKLCLYAPREIFANEVTIQSGFADGLLHLNLRNVDNAGRSVSGRDGLVQQLRQEAAQGNLTPAAAEQFLFVGDLSGYLDLALEVASFDRAGRAADARSLETTLQRAVFPHLDPLIPQAFADLRDRYIDLRADLTGPGLLAWCRGVLDTLIRVSAEKGLKIAYRLSLMADGG
jgi:hypothetical protein